MDRGLQKRGRLRLAVLPITPEIALLSRSSLFEHGDPADRVHTSVLLETLRAITALAEP